eukprot:425106-Hanusia_phi.AAC.1
MNVEPALSSAGAGEVCEVDEDVADVDLLVGGRARQEGDARESAGAGEDEAKLLEEEERERRREREIERDRERGGERGERERRRRKFLSLTVEMNLLSSRTISQNTTEEGEEDEEDEEEEDLRGRFLITPMERSR